MRAVPGRSPSTETVRRPATDVRPESRLLFRLAGEVDAHALAPRLAAPIDWDAFVRITLVEGATAVVQRRLAKAAAGAVPVEQAQRLAALARVSEFRLTFLEGRLLRAVSALEEAGIRAVLLKGAGLALTVYRGFSERPMADVDLLVAPDQAATAQRIITQQGWLHRTDVPRERPYDHHQHLPPLEDREGVGVGLEIHTDLFAREHPFAIAAADVRRRAREASFHGHAVLVPDPYDQLLHACLHFSWSHEMRFGAWKTFSDLDVLARSGHLDWDEFVRQARAARGASCCFWAMRLATELAAAPIPPEVLAALRPSMPRALERRLVRHFALQLIRGEAACPSDGLTRALWRVGVRPQASGHGRSLPWSATAGWGSAAPAPSPSAYGGRFNKAWRLVSYLATLAIPLLPAG